MSEYQLGTVESRFADLIWENEPLSSADLARRAEEVLNWKKSTTYTVLRRLCEKGIFQNDKGCVTSRISRDELNARQSEDFIRDTFDGSLPAFLAAFTQRQKLRPDEVAALRRVIDEYREED